MKILFRDLMTLLPEGARRTCVGVEGRRIVFVGDRVPDDFRPDRTVTGENYVLSPGFINAHTHLPMTLLRGVADDRPLQEWLFREIFPREDRLNDEVVTVGTEIALAESLASGVTSVSDMYFFSNAIVAAVDRCGIKANIARSLTSYEEGKDRNTDRRMLEQAALYRDWNGADDGRILVDESVHALYVSDPTVWRDAADIAREQGMIFHVHVSETRNENEECLQKYGKTPTAALAECGVFDSRVLAAHGVWLTDEDVEIYRSHGAVIAHCPVSNAKLASGIAPVCKYRDAGLRMALGTDGASSNNSLSMLGEMKQACLMAKILTEDARALTAGECFRMATAGGAYAQGREHECGEIREGMDADLVLLDFSRPNLQPLRDPVSSLVYAADPSNVAMTMVRGRVLYEHGEFTTIDMERLRREAVRASLSLEA